MLRYVVLLLAAALASGAHAQGVDPALTSSSWRAVEIAGTPATYAETLQFSGHRVTGKGACNRFSAALKLTGQSLMIGRPAVTSMLCQGRTDAEKRYLDALQAARSYALSGDMLSLHAADGRTVMKLTK